MEGPNNEIQELEVSSIQETIEQVCRISDMIQFSLTIDS